MKKKLLIPTHNPAKLNELRELLIDLPVKLVSLSDVGIYEDIEEDGKTYEENSQKKKHFFTQKRVEYHRFQMMEELKLQLSVMPLEFIPNDG